MLPLYRVLPAMKGYAREAWTVQRTVLTVAIIAVALVQVWIALVSRAFSHRSVVLRTAGASAGAGRLRARHSR